MKKLLIALVFILAGCTPPPPPSISDQPDYVPFVGAQPDWPTSAGAFAKNVNGIQIFAQDQFPSGRYDVLGRVNTDNLQRVAWLARLAHADAAIMTSATVTTNGFSIRTGGTSNAGGGGPFGFWGNNRGWANGIFQKQIDARFYLIKYRPDFSSQASRPSPK